MLEDFRLKVFLTLIEALSFTKAASVLGVTQPAVSQSISELEKNLGARLFDRQRGEISLTPAGRIFKIYAQEILDRYSEAEKLFTPLQPTVVNVYASDEVYDYMTGTLLKDFLLVHPEIVLMRSAEENAHFKARFIPIENKRGIFALCSDPSESFAGTDLWQMLSYCLKPTLQ
mgnify:CR=1 FL=1